MFDALGDLSPQRKRIDGSNRASEVIGRKGIMLSGILINMRDDLGRDEFADKITLGLVNQLVLALRRQ